VDTLSIPKQQMGSSWASRMVAVGSLIGYGAGAIDLQRIFGLALGDTQFKQLTAVAAFSLCATVGLTSWAVTERVLISNGSEGERLSAVQVLTTIAKSAVDMPRGIAAICYVQFWAWIGGSITAILLQWCILTSSRMVPFSILQHYMGW
jgi:solute carrier family 45 protein 1/2/4